MHILVLSRLNFNGINNQSHLVRSSFYSEYAEFTSFQQMPYFEYNSYRILLLELKYCLGSQTSTSMIIIWLILMQHAQFKQFKMKRVKELSKEKNSLALNAAALQDHLLRKNNFKLDDGKPLSFKRSTISSTVTH
jgi:hypothetical protein